MTIKTARNRIAFLASAPLFVIILALIAPIVPALAHAELRRSDPAAGDTLDRAPAEIFLWFTQPLSTGSKINVFDNQFQNVDMGETFIDASDATLMRAKLGSLAPGRYTVNWKATAVDGHQTSGSYDFFVRETPGLSPMTIAAAAAAVILVVVGLVLLRGRRRRA